ncbi:MAG: sensor histidine kinase [Chitinophagaceae bacterium]
MRAFHSLLILLFFSVPALAQQALADSVSKILQQKEIHDTVKAYNLVMLAMYTEPLDINKAHTLYKEAVDFSLSRKLDYYAGMALYYQATPYHITGQREKQFSNLQRAIELLEKLDSYKAKNELAGVYSSLSNYYRSAEKFDSAISASLRSIKIQEDIKSYRRIVSSCLNLAMIYQQLKMPEKQKEYTEKGLTCAKQSGKNDALMLAYLQMASYYIELKDYSLAKNYADSATPYFDESYDFSRIQNFYLLKAGTFQNVKIYDSAVLYFKKCYENASASNSRWNMTEPLMQIGYIYLQQKDYINAEKNLKLGLEIAETDSIRFFMKEGYGTLSDVYAATGRYKEAFELLKKYNDIKDTLLNEDRKKFALELEKKYETQKKDDLLKNQQSEIAQRKRLNYALAGGAAVLVLTILLLFRNYKQKQRLQQQRIIELETKEKLAATEAVLKGEEKERTRLAKDLHDGLGGMLSGIKYSFQTMKGNLIMTPENQQAFERSMDMLDSSIKEMRRVSHNLMPEVLVRYGLDAALKDYTTEVNKSGIIKVVYQSMGMEQKMIEQSSALGLYRIVQELLNNVIKHAAATEVLVQVFSEKDKLVVNVEDNGKGIDPAIMEKAEGMGWKNIRSRVDLLNGKIDIQSAASKGTAVNLEFIKI